MLCGKARFTIYAHGRGDKAANAKDVAVRPLIAARSSGIALVRGDSSPGQSVRLIDCSARNADDAMELSNLDARRF